MLDPANQQLKALALKNNPKSHHPLFLGAGSRNDQTPISNTAHAVAASESGALAPGMVAQPPFSIKLPRDHVSVFLSSTRLASCLPSFLNLSTQTGASAVATASLACCVPLTALWPAVCQPPTLKPTNANAIAPATAPQIAGFVSIGSFIFHVSRKNGKGPFRVGYGSHTYCQYGSRAHGWRRLARSAPKPGTKTGLRRRFVSFHHPKCSMRPYANHSALMA